MKTHTKKKKFQQFCRSQVMQGLVNQADGTWRAAQTTKAMDNSMIHGYRVGGKK